MKIAITGKITEIYCRLKYISNQLTFDSSTMLCLRLMRVEVEKTYSVLCIFSTFNIGLEYVAYCLIVLPVIPVFAVPGVPNVPLQNLCDLRGHLYWSEVIVHVLYGQNLQERHNDMSL